MPFDRSVPPGKTTVHVRVLGADLLTVHVQLSTAPAGHPGGPVPAAAVQPSTPVLTPAQK